MTKRRITNLLICVGGTVLVGLLLDRLDFSYNADGLYLPVMLDHSLLYFRTPPSPYLVPDALLHLFARIFVDSTSGEMVVAGSLQLFVIILSVVLVAGPVPAVLATLTLLLVAPELAVKTSYHFGLIPLSLLYATLSSEANRTLVAFVGMLSDPLFAAVWFVIPFARDQTSPLFARSEITGIIAGAIGATVLGETSLQIVRLGILMGVCVLIVNVILRVDWLREHVVGHTGTLVLVTSGLLFVVTSVGIIPAKYGIPVFGSILFTSLKHKDYLHPFGVDNSDTILVFVLFGGVSLSFMYHETMNADFLEASHGHEGWTCAIKELQRRGIDTIALDYWDAKPLYVGQRKAGTSIDILQVDLTNNMPDTWGVPYRMAYGQTEYLLIDKLRCPAREGNSLHCTTTSSRLPRIANDEVVCKHFRLIEYASAIPSRESARQVNVFLDGKIGSVYYNFRNNYRKLVGGLAW